MLGWWTDESKGYCLEDLETPRKLISSCDVDFIKDSSPNNLAIINNISPSPESINKLVNDAISTKSTTLSFSAPDPTKVHLPESHPSTPPLSLSKSYCQFPLYQRRSLSGRIYPKENLRVKIVNYLPSFMMKINLLTSVILHLPLLPQLLNQER